MPWAMYDTPVATCLHIPALTPIISAVAERRGDSPIWGLGLSLAVIMGLVCLVIALVWWDMKRSGQSLALYLGFRALWLFCKMWHGVRPVGQDPVPSSGAAIIISNHTSPADPLFLQCGTRRVVSFMMAREYYNIKFLRPIFRLNNPILVNRTGRDTAAMKATLRALSEGRVVGVFPEGGIHLDPDTLGPAKAGMAMLALLTRAPVIPAFIDRRPHTNRLWYGILRPLKTRLIFGRPIDLTPFCGREHDHAAMQEATELLMNSIDRLRPRSNDGRP